MNQSRKMTEGALLLAVYVVILLISFFVPVLSFFAMFLLPLPFVLYTARYGAKASLVMFAVALVLTMLFATVFSLPLTVLMGLGGIAIGQAIFKGRTAYETLAQGTLGFIAGILFTFVVSQVLLSVNLIKEMETLFMESVQTSMSVLENVGGVAGTAEMEEMMQQQVQMLIDLLPVGVAIGGIFLAFLTQWIGYKFINRLDKKQLKFPPFRNLRFPTSIVWVYFFALLFSFFELDQSGMMYMAVQNVFVLTGLLMALQGMSFVFFYAHKKKITRALPVLAIVLTILFPTFLLYFMRILGIIDIGFRMRDRLTEKK